MTHIEHAGAMPAVAISEKKPLPAFMMMGGGALLVLGSFLPWAKVSFSGLGSGLADLAGVDTSTTVGGMDGDGTITLVLGVALAVIGFLTYSKAWNKGLLIGGMVVAALAGITSAVDVADVSKFSPDAGVLGDVGIDASVGIGLWLCLVAAIGGLAGAFLAFRDKPAS